MTAAMRMTAAPMVPVAKAGTSVGGRDRAEVAAAMDEDQFRAFYADTARPLRGYLVHATGNPTLADDLLQEAYYRLLRARLTPRDADHRRNYLFRIATNLIRDQYRRRPREVAELPVDAGRSDHGDDVHLKSDLHEVLRELRPRDRQMLWLAYVEGLRHDEIGDVLGIGTASVRPMLFRARKRMAEILTRKGLAP